MGVENLTPKGIRCPDRPSRSESLYRLICTGSHIGGGTESKPCSSKIRTPLDRHRAYAHGSLTVRSRSACRFPALEYICLWPYCAFLVIAIANTASHILGYWLNPRSRILFEMPIFLYLVKKFPGFYETRRSTAVFTSAVTCCSAQPDQFRSGPPILLLKHNKQYLTEMWLPLQCEGPVPLAL